MASENCKLQERVDSIGVQVDNLDVRVNRLEANMATGFNAVTAAVNNLATDFGTRMNTIDKRLVEEKTKWGDSFRKWLDWSLKVILLGCLAAMGMTAYKIVFGN